MAECDDDLPQLSAETFAALQEFYKEQQKRQEILEKLESDNKLTENIIFDENWQLSQFWYDESTVQTMVKIVDKITPSDGKVALLSCPTLFVPLKRQIGNRATVSLFEYDRRFEIHGQDFIFYDYNVPEKIPPDSLHTYDIIIADPPFLSEECLGKTSKTVKLLSKEKIILCTGAVMEQQVEQLLDLKVCQFKPHHKNNLANEFSCYANFNLDEFVR